MYNEYFLKGKYENARAPWLQVFTDCPGLSKQIYITGAAIYEKLIRDEKTFSNKTKLLDTLYLIYDQQIRYFGEEGTVTGKKGLAKYFFEPDSRNEIKVLLKKSITLEGSKSDPLVLEKYFQVNTELYSQKKLSKGNIIDEYDLVNGLFEAKLIANDTAGINQSVSNVDALFDLIISCSDLVDTYNPRFNATPADVILLRKIVSVCNKKSCFETSLYLEAAELLYKTEPSAVTAHNLAKIYKGKNDFVKANIYFKEAMDFESDNDKKAELLIEIAEMYCYNMKDYSQARTYAQRAASLKSNWGKPYLLMGDIYISGSATCNGDFNGAEVYWVATDQYEKAKSIDLTYAVEADKKIKTTIKFYPKQDIIAKHGKKAGDVVTLKCWINETTTIRVQ